MNTHNIVSTPDITGSIVTCTSNSIVVDTGYTIFTNQYKTLVTNSCTGQVKQYDSWNLGAFPWVVIVLGILIFWVIIGSAANKDF